MLTWLFYLTLSNTYFKKWGRRNVGRTITLVCYTQFKSWQCEYNKQPECKQSSLIPQTFKNSKILATETKCLCEDKRQEGKT